MSNGKVKWFSNARGYGFILADDTGKDIFVHHSSIKMDGYRTLNEGDPVLFDLVDGPKGPKAENVSRADGATPAADGATPAANGATPVADGATPVTDGVVPVADGVATVEEVAAAAELPPATDSIEQATPSA